MEETTSMVMIKIVLVGVVSWAGLFVCVRRSLPKRSFEFSNRIVSTVHATLAVTLATISLLHHSPNLPDSKSSYHQMQTLAISLSYLIYDLICCLFDTRVNLDNTVHHLVSIVGIIAGLAYQKCGWEMVGALWITEISSPFLHLRENLKELGHRDTDLNLAADLAFAVIFSFARMVVGPYLTFVTLSAPNNPLLIKVFFSKFIYPCEIII